MMLSPNFSLDEFIHDDYAVQNGISNMPPNKYVLGRLRYTANKMEEVRTLLGNLPIKILSGYRGPGINPKMGSNHCRDHLQGYACDFVCPDFGTPYEVAKRIALSELTYDQIIHEKHVPPNDNWWVHISFNPISRNLRNSHSPRGFHLGIKANP